MEELLTRGIDGIIGRQELEDALKSKRKLRLKLGVDPTRPDIHLGHTVLLRKLREFQDLGHTVIFLIGDYTTKIGDPSGKSKTRPVLTDDVIDANAQTYLDQVGKILDMETVEIRRNSEWLSKLTFADVIGLASQTSVAQLIERDDFKNRLASGSELALHELLYPLMQAYDSVMLEADVEFGGTDQLFNLLAGRSLQKKLGQAPQAVITADLLIGLDGKHKMSKSLDNYVGINDEPTDMYGKVMSLPDPLIASYYRLCTNVPMAAIDALIKTIAEGANPRDAKASLAREIVSMYHGSGAALEAEEAWNRQFKEGGLPEDIPEMTVSDRNISLVALLIETGMATSRNEARRVIEQGGVRLNGLVEPAEREINVDGPLMLQVGKRRYVMVKPA